MDLPQVVGWQLGMEQSATNPRQYSLSLEVLIIPTNFSYHSNRINVCFLNLTLFSTQLLDPSTEEHPVPCICRMGKCALIKALLDKEEEEMEDMEELPPQLV